VGHSNNNNLRLLNPADTVVNNSSNSLDSTEVTRHHPKVSNHTVKHLVSPLVGKLLESPLSYPNGFGDQTMFL
jgi:hypothetical protein